MNTNKYKGCTVEMIRKAGPGDISRIAEILVFNKRMNYRKIFGDDDYSFNILQVMSVAEKLEAGGNLDGMYVYDDGIVKGLVHIEGREINELYVEHFFQNEGIGKKLIEFAVKSFECDRLWVLEKNEGARRFYEANGFSWCGEKKHEEDTPEFLLLYKRKANE